MSHIHHSTFSTLSSFQNNHDFMFLSIQVAEIIALCSLRKDISSNLIT